MPVEKCWFHDEAMEALRDELKRGSDEFRLLRGDIKTLSESLVEHGTQITTLNLTVNNGLRADIRRTTECVMGIEEKFSGVCKRYDEKMEEFDKFKWFRDIANAIRDSATKKVISMAFVGGMIISIIFFIMYVSEKYAKYWEIVK